jgi:hypothetical protein
LRHLRAIQDGTLIALITLISTVSICDNLPNLRHLRPIQNGTLIALSTLVFAVLYLRLSAKSRGICVLSNLRSIPYSVLPIERLHWPRITLVNTLPNQNFLYSQKKNF